MQSSNKLTCSDSPHSRANLVTAEGQQQTSWLLGGTTRQPSRWKATRQLVEGGGQAQHSA